MIRFTILASDPPVRQAIGAHLSARGMRSVDPAGASAGPARPADDGPDVLVLDAGASDGDGLATLARLRADRAGVAIVMLGTRGALADRLHALQAGADAYLVKPVDLRELALVIEGLCRRSLRGAGDPHWTLDVFRKTLTSPQGETAPLTHNECELLRALADAAPDVVDRSALARAIGHPEPDFDFRRLETALSRLRAKLQTRCAEGSPLQTARGIGYLFAAPVRVRGDRARAAR